MTATAALGAPLDARYALTSESARGANSAREIVDRCGWAESAVAAATRPAADTRGERRITGHAPGMPQTVYRIGVQPLGMVAANRGWILASHHRRTAANAASITL